MYAYVYSMIASIVQWLEFVLPKHEVRVRFPVDALLKGGCSSIGRVRALQARGTEIETRHLQCTVTALLV